MTRASQWAGRATNPQKCTLSGQAIDCREDLRAEWGGRRWLRWAVVVVAALTNVLVAVWAAIVAVVANWFSV